MKEGQYATRIIKGNFQINSLQYLEYPEFIYKDRKINHTVVHSSKSVLLLWTVVLLPLLLHRASCSLSHNLVSFQLSLYRSQLGLHIVQNEAYNLQLWGLVFSLGQTGHMVRVSY